MAACLMLCLTACSTTKIEGPPDSLLSDCAHAPKPPDHTNAGLANFAKAERDALDVCNTDKAALRAWKAGL